MYTVKRLVTACVTGLLFLLLSGFAMAGTDPSLARVIPPEPHAFDFDLGTWTTHIHRLIHPLTGSKTWVDLTGTVRIHKIWGGKAQLEEIEAGSAAHRFESLTVFLYNPQSHQWYLYFANSSDGVLTKPSIGEFKDGKGVFYDQEPYMGRSILVRITWSHITQNTHRFEQAFSDDGGKTWETNFIADKTRVKSGDTVMMPQPVGNEPGQHDFDWQFGYWSVHVSRLACPFTGLSEWEHFDGTVRVHKVWNGRANVAEMDSEGPSGHIQILSLRLFNTSSHQWSLSFASSEVGAMSQPMIGEFRHGSGIFYGQDNSDNGATLVRYAFLGFTKQTDREEQAFLTNGGAAWKINWVNESRQIKRAAGQLTDEWSSQ